MRKATRHSGESELVDLRKGENLWDGKAHSAVCRDSRCASDTRGGEVPVLSTSSGKLEFCRAERIGVEEDASECD